MRKIFLKLKNCNDLVNTHYHIGLRVVKTAVVVMICLFISLLMKSHNIVQISAVSALVTLRSTQKDTLHTGIARVVGTIFGGTLGMITVLIGLILPYYSDGLFVIIIPLMIVLDLYFCNVLKMPDSCSISCVVLIIVASQINMDATAGETLVYTLLRIRDTMIGVIITTIMNSLPIPKPKEEPNQSC